MSQSLESKVDMILMGDKQPKENYLKLMVEVITAVGKAWGNPNFQDKQWAHDSSAHLLDMLSTYKRVAYVAPTYGMRPAKDMSKMSAKEREEYIVVNAQNPLMGASGLCDTLGKLYGKAPTFPFDVTVMVSIFEMLAVLEGYRRHYCSTTVVDSVYFIGHGGAFLTNEQLLDNPTLPMERASTILSSIKTGFYPPIGKAQQEDLKAIWITCNSEDIVTELLPQHSDLAGMYHLYSNGKVNNHETALDEAWVEFSLAPQAAGFKTPRGVDFKWMIAEV